MEKNIFLTAHKLQPWQQSLKMQRNLTETLSKRITEKPMKIIADVSSNKCLDIVTSRIHELQAIDIWSHISTLLYVCRSSGEGRHPSIKFYNWHLELWCQPHWCAEPDSFVNWQRFKFFACSTGVWRVTYCIVAAISHANWGCSSLQVLQYTFVLKFTV